MVDNDAGPANGAKEAHDEKLHDEKEQESSTKVQDLAKAGRKDFDPNAGHD